MARTKSIFSKYPLHQKMWENFTNDQNGSFNILKSSILPYNCESYAKSHPDSPFYNELMGIFAFLDAGPGTPSYREHFQQKFASLDVLLRQTFSKIDEWMFAHPDDLEVLCLRAGIETVVNWNKNRTISVGHLARIMVDVTNTSSYPYTYLWCTIANAVQLWNHLGFMEKEEQQKAYIAANKITLRDVILTWLFVAYPMLVANLTIYGYTNFEWFTVLGFLGIPILLIILSCTLFAKLLHKPLKITLSVTGVLAFLWGFMQYDSGGASTSFFETMHSLSQGNLNECSVGWYLIACLVLWILIVAVYRTVSWLWSLGGK